MSNIGSYFLGQLTKDVSNRLTKDRVDQKFAVHKFQNELQTKPFFFIFSRNSPLKFGSEDYKHISLMNN